jgi:hypothetical protein
MRKLLICIVAVMAYGLAAAQTLSGVYRTDFNELTLTQNGNRVTGTYKHQNGRLEGTLVGNTLTGWWYQDNGKGRLEFVFSPDYSNFQGKWGYNDAVPTSKWNGTRIGSAPGGFPVSAPATGVYSTDFNELTLTQTGDRIAGTYKYQNGRVEGTIIGNTFTGWWYQDNGKGRLEFVFNADFSAFEGKWGYNDATPTGKWNGKRVGGGQPISAPNVTRLNGVYNTDFNELTITQTGNSVTGTYKYQNGRIEGTLNGNVLTGWWYQDNGKGRFEFVFNADFSAFEGRWGYNDVAPTGKWNGTKIR